MVEILDHLEIVDRAMTGERLDEKEYDMHVFKNIQELIKELNLKPDPENPVPSDDSLADEVFEAGLMLAEKIGIYCLDTRRVFKVTEDEIKKALKEIREEVTVGSGKDTRKLTVRKPEDSHTPFYVGCGTTPLSEELYDKIMQSIALQPIDSIASSNLYTIGGRRIIGMPLEVYANRRAIEWTREAIRKAEKPNLCIINYPINSRAYVNHALLDQDHIRPNDILNCAHLPEGFKLEYDTLTTTHTAHEYGSLTCDHTTGMVGLYAGGPEGVVIHNIADAVLAQTVLNNDIELMSVRNAIDMRLNEIPEIFWAKSLICQALSRNTKIKTRFFPHASSEPGCKEWFIHRAQLILTYVPSGSTIVDCSGRPNQPLRENLCGPLEIEFCLEIGNASKEFKRKEANEFVKKLYSLLPKEELLKGPFKGMNFQESYDVNTFKPKKEFLELYQAMYHKIKDMGIVS